MFTLQQKQTVKAYLEKSQQEGVVCTYDILPRLDKEIAQQIKSVSMSEEGKRKAREKKNTEKQVPEKLKPTSKKCPECGSKQWYPVRREGVEYMGCRDCRFSKLIGGE